MYVLRTLAFLMLSKGERKLGILRNQDVIFSKALKLSINSKRKGEKGTREIEESI